MLPQLFNNAFVHVDVIVADKLVELIRSQCLGNTLKHTNNVTSMEEWLFSKDERSKYSAHSPHVQAVVVSVVVEQEFGCLEEPNADGVASAWLLKCCRSPAN